MSNFTWLPFFEEMLNVICTKYDKESLCKIFHEIFYDVPNVYIDNSYLFDN